jgi:DNA-binding transcriptional ArsR family regulator
MKAAARTWADAIRIKAGPKLVLQALVRRMNARTALCIPSVETLAADTGLAQSTVRLGLRDLEAHGLVHVERRRDLEGRQTSHRFHLHIGASPMPVGKRKDTERRAKKGADQTPNFGGWDEADAVRNSVAGQTPKFGAEYLRPSGASAERAESSARRNLPDGVLSIEALRQMRRAG